MMLATRKITRKRLYLALALLVIVPNALVYRHARAMLTFVEMGERTRVPESLSLWRKGAVLLTGVTLTRPVNRVQPDSVGLPYSTLRVPVRDGLALEAWRMDHPDPRGLVLMFPGYGQAKAALLPEARAFYDFGYDVWLVDFRGCGGSDPSGTSIGYHEAEDVAAVMRQVAEAQIRRPVILYGQSMGGAAILRAIAKSDVRPDAVIVEAVFDTMVATVGHRFHAMRLPAFPFAHWLVFWGSAHMGGNGFSHNPVDYAAHVTCPTLVLYGAADARVAPAEARRVYAALTGPKAEHEFASALHGSLFSVHSEEWTRVVSAFL